jgi:uncharacterized cupredoxin-like copper-binding protein
MRTAGLALWTVAFVACGAAGPTAGEDVRTIEVGMHFSAFDPARIDVVPGETIRFVLSNTDPIDHEFILGDREVQRIHERGTEAHHGTKPGEVTVAAGQTVETTVTFASEPGQLLFGCHSPGHWDYGMRGVVLMA